MTDVLVRTRQPREQVGGPRDGGSAKGWVLPDVVVQLRDQPGDPRSDVHEAADALCVLIGHVSGGRGAAEVLDLYRSKGLDAIARLDGEFVVVLHDRHRRATHILRDKSGFGHAYYWARGGHFAASTDLPWVTRAPCAPPVRASAHGLALYMTFQYVPEPASVVADVNQLPPGAALSVDAAGRTDVRRLARFPEPRPQPEAPEVGADPDVTLQAHGEQILELITQAAADLLADDAGPICATMSGGMDTSTNAIVLVEQLGLRPTAFTAAFHESFFDESAFAARMAEHLGLEHVLVTVESGLIEELPSVARLFETPNADQAAFAEYFLGRAMAERGFRAVVTGEGGDEVLGIPQSHEELRDFGVLPTDPSELARYYLGKTDLADASLRRELFGMLAVPQEAAYEPLTRLYRDYVAEPAFDRVLYGQWRTWMVDGVYMKDTRVFRHFGLTPVLPLMDPALMRYVADLPPEIRPIGLQDKRFLRAALGDRLPPEVLNRPKHKFWLPFADWFRAGARDFINDHLLSDGFVRDVFGGSLPERLLREHQSGTDHSRVLWALLFLELWWNGHFQPTDQTENTRPGSRSGCG